MGDTWGLMIESGPPNPKVISYSSLNGGTTISLRRGWMREIDWSVYECVDEFCLEVGWWAYGADLYGWPPSLTQGSSKSHHGLLLDAVGFSASYMNSIRSMERPALVRIVLVPEGYSFEVRFRSDQPDPILLFVFPVDAKFNENGVDEQAFEARLVQAFAVAAHEFSHLDFAIAIGYDRAISPDYIESNEARAVCAGLTLESILAQRFGVPLNIQAQSDSSYQFMMDHLEMTGPGAASVMVRSRMHRSLLEALRSEAPLALSGRHSAVIEPSYELGHSVIREKCRSHLTELGQLVTH